MYRALTIITLFIFSSCCKSTVAPVEEQTQLSFEEKAFQLFDTNTVILPNESGDMAIMYQKSKFSARNPNPTLDVIIYDRASDEVIYRTSLLRGKVKWISNEDVHFYSTPGQVSREGETVSGYYYHVYKKEVRK